MWPILEVCLDLGPFKRPLHEVNPLQQRINVLGQSPDADLPIPEGNHVRLTILFNFQDVLLKDNLKFFLK